MKYVGGAILGVVGTLAFLSVMATVSGIDTVKAVTERGFYTFNDRLYVVRPASPVEVQ